LTKPSGVEYLEEIRQYSIKIVNGFPLSHDDTGGELAEFLGLTVL
jgi:hypothetical protein